MRTLKTLKDIEDLGDIEIKNAFVRPHMPKIVNKIYNFLDANKNLVTSISAMDYYMTGLDRYKLASLAKGYNIDIFKYMFVVDMYEEAMLKQQAENRKS